jgi:alkylhydroperoxidase family enzyme
MADPLHQPRDTPHLPYPEAESLSDEKRDVLDGKFGRVLNISHMLMHAPDPFWRGQRALGRATVWDSTIGEALRELLILRVAHLSRSDYELYHHLPLARTFGVPEEKCEAMRTGAFDCLTERERALAQFVTELVLDVTPREDTLREMRAHFPDDQLLEVVLTVGYYMMIARVIGATGIEMDETAVEKWTR